MTDLNVVSLLDRIAASKLAGEQVALEANYEPSAKDIRTFLQVLRHLQKRSDTQVASIELGSDLLKLQISEFEDNDPNDERTAFMDHTVTTRSLAFNLPWQLFDLDESEISRDSNGIDAIDRFSEIVLKWMNTIKIDRS
ncbi:hypothetical protein D3C75_590720 [compost metagenome]